MTNQLVGFVFGIVRMGFFSVLCLTCLHPPNLADHYYYLQAPAPPPVVPSGVVLAAAPASSATLVDLGDTTGGNNAVNPGNLITKKTKTNEKALLLSDDEFQ